MKYICIKDKIKNLNIVIGCTLGCAYCYARNNCNRYRIIEDFSKPEFFESKLRLMDKKKPGVFLLTGMSDLAGWKKEWIEKVFKKIKENPQHSFIFLTKRPDLINIKCDLENAWFGVTVTSKKDLWRIKALKENIKAKHYHVTFEPLFDNPGIVDLSGIEWIVIGTMTGAMSKKIQTEVDWTNQLTKQAKKLDIPVFWKEDLKPIMGEENIVQEFPVEFFQNKLDIKFKI